MTPITLIIGPQKPVFCSEKFAAPAGLTRRRRRARRRPRSASRRLGARRPPPFFRGGNNGKQRGRGTTDRGRAAGATPSQAAPADRPTARRAGAASPATPQAVGSSGG